MYKVKSMSIREFMEEGRKPKIPKGFKVHSIIPPSVIPSMFLSKGTLLIVTVAGVIVAVKVAEWYLFSKGKEAEAETLSDVFGLLLPASAIGSAIYFLILKNPFVRVIL